MKLILLTHDLSCTIDNLGRAASRHSTTALAHLFDSTTPSTRDPSYNLFVAAIEFAVQLAIDQGDQDPTEMRALERALIAKIVETP